MRKSFTIFIALVLTLFTVPFSGLTAFAQEGSYDNLEYGEYLLDIKLLKEGTDEESAAAGFMKNEATLSVEDGENALTFYIPKNDMMSFNDFVVEGIDPVVEEEDDLYNYTFEPIDVKELLSSTVSYEVPALNLVHDNVGMDIQLLGLDELPEREDEPEGAEDERVVGEHIAESEADALYTIDYETDSRATAGQLENPVKVLEKDGKSFVQIPVSEGGANFFRSLKFNDEEVLWNSITEAPFVIQYELEEGLEDEIDVSMVIQAGPNVMPHDDIKLWFDLDS